MPLIVPWFYGEEVVTAGQGDPVAVPPAHTARVRRRPPGCDAEPLPEPLPEAQERYGNRFLNSAVWEKRHRGAPPGETV
ncbi:hypothetical protein [Streptomyces sp. NPDC059278]|uniref:hypothetical protein n=1 Tax=Streptomyces sp. NPDC059278 TaxID=3346801 RepID=UPI003677FE95